MASAIPTVPGTNIVSQIVGQAVVSQPAKQTNSPQTLPSAAPSLGATLFAPPTYNAVGALDTGNSSSSATGATVSQTIPTRAPVDTTAPDKNAPSTQLAVALEASSIAENSAILDDALADSLAKQLVINASAIAAGVATKPAAVSPTDVNLAGTANSIESSGQLEIATQAIASNNARTLDELLSAGINLASPETASTAGKEIVALTNRAAMLPLPTPLPESLTNEPNTVVASAVPATASNVVAASNTTTMNSLGSPSEVDNSPVANPAIDSAAQAFSTVVENPAYANLVAGNYVSMAAASAQAPSVTATPMRLEEIKPVIAIPAVAAVTQIGAQVGRDGNPPSGYRQRAPNFSALRSRS